MKTQGKIILQKIVLEPSEQAVDQALPASSTKLGPRVPDKIWIQPLIHHCLKELDPKHIIY